VGDSIHSRLPRAVHPLKVFFTFNAHLEFSYFSYYTPFSLKTTAVRRPFAMIYGDVVPT
jgi:hypothetical protein